MGNNINYGVIVAAAARAILGAGALGLASLSATATPPPAWTNLNCPSTYPTPGVQTCRGSGGGVTTVMQTSFLDTSALVQADFTQSRSFGLYAALVYYVEIESSNSDFGIDWIPLVFRAAGTAEVVGDGNFALATVDFNGRYWQACAGVACASIAPNSPTSFAGDYTINLQPRSAVYRVTVEASGSSNTVNTSSSFRAWADPYMWIEPSFLATHPQLSLAFSAGTMQAIPEPASLILFGAGLAGLGVRGWQRRS